MKKHDISCNIIRMANAKLKYDTATRSKLYILTSNIHIRLFDVQLAILYSVLHHVPLRLEASGETYQGCYNYIL